LKEKVQSLEQTMSTHGLLSPRFKRSLTHGLRRCVRLGRSAEQLLGALIDYLQSILREGFHIV
jgi:hypothetical protein